MSSPQVHFCAPRFRVGVSSLERARQETVPRVPEILQKPWCAAESDPVPADAAFTETIKSLFPSTQAVRKCSLGSGEPVFFDRGLRIGVCLSGGQAPGGHNVIAGVYDAAKRTGSDFEVYGFNDGPHGIFSGRVTRIDDLLMDGYRNTGGFDMIGSGRHKIETDEHFQASTRVCEQLDLDGVVIIGGDDSNTNAALLAEHFSKSGCKTRVIGCPKTIDGDLKCPPSIPVSFGFDTACRTYAELVGNVAVDALSSQKYYHFCRLMGRSASNIALEVALLTLPNVCLLGEEVQTKNMSLKQITDHVVGIVRERAKAGKSYGVVLLPEGLIEFIPEFNAMIAEINDLGDGLKEEDVLSKLSPENSEKFRFLPAFLRAQLLLDRDPHGNVQVAKIETEQLLASCISQELDRLKSLGEFDGTFTPQFHAFGYEGRAGLPSSFDANYCYSLGYTAGVLLASGKTGLISSVTKLSDPVEKWECGGVPITSLCVVERRKGKDKPVIKKALVELEGSMSQPFKAWEAIRDKLSTGDFYRNSGPIQFDISCPVSLDLPVTLALELGVGRLEVDDSCPEVVRFGTFLHCPRPVSSRSKLDQWRIESFTSTGALNLATVKAVSVGATRPPMKSDIDAIKKVFPTTCAAPLVELIHQAPAAQPLIGKLPFNPQPRASSESSELKVHSSSKVGIVFCGRQCPGGHDVLFGLAEVMKQFGGEAFGFVGGAKGLFKGHAVPLNDIAATYHRTSGFDLLGRTMDRTAETESDKAQALAACEKLKLTGLVLIGGTRTASDAAYLSEYFAEHKSKTSVVVVPSGIEGSLLNPFVEVSLGFDSASKTVSQLVANTCTDGASARKYYYFIRCMDGSSTGMEATSHIALEVALAVRPNVALIGEEIAEKRLSLEDIVSTVADAVCLRAHEGKNFGTVLVPEGLLASVLECRVLMSEIGKCKVPCTPEEAVLQMSSFSAALMKSFPEYIQRELLLERQSNGQIQLSQVQTERLVADMVSEELVRRKSGGASNRAKSFVGTFSPVCQFVGYQARCSMPSNFDCCYGRALGKTAGILASSGCNGYLATVSGLGSSLEKWRCAGAPISSVSTHSEDGSARVAPQPILMQGPAWRAWLSIRTRCVMDDEYRNPGPIQFSGTYADRVTETLLARSSQWGSSLDYLSTLDELEDKVNLLRQVCRPGCEVSLARVASRMLGSMEEIVSLVSEQRSP